MSWQITVAPIIASLLLVIIARNKHEWTSESILIQLWKDVNTQPFSSPPTLIYSPVWFVCWKKIEYTASWLVRSHVNQTLRGGSRFQKGGFQSNAIEQRWRTSVLESRSPAEFCFNPNQTHLSKLVNVWNVTRKLQAGELSLGLELNSAGLGSSSGPEVANPAIEEPFPK